MTDLVTGEAVRARAAAGQAGQPGASPCRSTSSSSSACCSSGPVLIGGTASSVDDALAAAIGLVFYLVGDRRLPGRVRDAHPGPDARARWRWGCASCARTAARCGSGRRSSAALLGVVEIWLTVRRGRPDRVARLQPGPAGRRLPRGHRRRARAGARLGRRRWRPCPRSWPAGPSGLDLSRVPDDLALAARQFLARARELAPEVREPWGRAGRARWPRCTARHRRPGPRPGRSCRPCWPSGGAARWRGSARPGAPRAVRGMAGRRRARRPAGATPRSGRRRHRRRTAPRSRRRRRHQPTAPPAPTTEARQPVRSAAVTHGSHRVRPSLRGCT